MGRLTALFVAILLFHAGPVRSAGESPAAPLTLAAAVDAAWSRSPEARELTQRAREWAARRELADGVVAGPGSVSLSHAADREDPGHGKAEWEVEFIWPLWLPGQREARQTLADREAGALEARRAALRVELAGEVGRRHATWRLARGEAELTARRAADARALEADLERRLRVGAAARFDANLARGERLAAETAAGEAALAAEQATAQWSLLTGLTARGDSPLQLPPVPVVADTEPPAVAAARHAESAAAARVRAELATTRDAPELSLRMLRQRDGQDQPWGDQLGVKVTLPFGGGAGWRAATAAAEAEQARAAAGLDAELRRSELERRQSEAELSRAETALAATVRRQRLAEDNARLADQAYRLGQFDLATLLRARGAAFEAALDVRRAEIRQQQARLQQLLSLGVTP